MGRRWGTQGDKLASMSVAFSRAAAGLPSNCRLHGLKKAGMTRFADAGATAHELMAISGHKTLSQVQLYTRDANDKKLADSAMAKRQGQNENSDVTNMVPRLH